MSFNTDLMESINIVSAFVAGSDANADLTGDWVSLKNYDGCLVYLKKPVGTAGDDLSIRLQQATDVAGTGAKALNFNNLYHKIGATALTGVGTFTRIKLTTPTDDLDLVSVNSVDLETDVNETQVVVNVRASDLDVSGGFDCMNLIIEGDDIGNALIISADYILYGARFSGNPTPSAIVD
jgi:hypothetical protein